MVMNQALAWNCTNEITLASARNHKRLFGIALGQSLGLSLDNTLGKVLCKSEGDPGGDEIRLLLGIAPGQLLGFVLGNIGGKLLGESEMIQKVIEKVMNSRWCDLRA